MQQRAIHLLFALVLILILIPSIKGKYSGLGLTIDIFLISLGLLVLGYVAVFQYDILYRAGSYSNFEIILSGCGILLVLEITRRTTGIVVPLVSLLFLAYSLLGQYCPEIIAHKGFSLSRTVSSIFLHTEGVFGIALDVSASFIFMFILLGAVLRASGTGELFIGMASALFGHVRGGPAKIAIIASCFFGSISGSAVANVAGIGTFTIPLMKRLGYSGTFAGAVEAAASSGGQLMPPIMGAAAFIMAQMLDVPYVTVAVAAAVPAILYYISLFIGVDIEAQKKNLRGLPREELPKIKDVFSHRWHLLISPLVLVYLLGVLQFSPQVAAFYAIIVSVLASMMTLKTRINFWKIINAMEETAKDALGVAAACACVGMILGVLMLTGLGLKLSGILLTISGDNLIVMLILTMVTSIILGMGLPVTACYLILAVMVAPGLTSLGISALAAHLFVLYFGVISNITPPFALAAYAAAAISGADPNRTGFTAFKLGCVSFTIPYIFVFWPGVILKDTLLMIIVACLVGIASIAMLAVALGGYLKGGKVTLLARGLLLIASILVIFPGMWTTIIGLLLGGMVFTKIFYKTGRKTLCSNT